MNGGRSRRFSRTTKAAPQPQPKIEREKIRHRRPNDLLTDDNQAQVSRQTLVTEEPDGTVYEDGPYYDDDDSADETSATPVTYDEVDTQEDDEPEAEGWDDEPEGDWVLDTDQDDGDYDHAEEESGVVWEDEGLDDEDIIAAPDEVAFDNQQPTMSDDPEFELAGRRDVRPKPPKPPHSPKPRSTAPTTKPQRRAQNQQRPPREPDWDAESQPGLREHPQDGIAFETDLQSLAPPPVSSGRPSRSGGERFSRTRATVGTAAGHRGSAGEKQVLQPARGKGATNRRRQAQPAAAAARPQTVRLEPSRQRKRRGGWRLGTGVLLILLVVVGGLFAFQSTSPEGIQPLIDRVTAFIPLPGSPRTAADTSFGEGSEPVTTPESGATTPAPVASNPVAPTTDGPPIPQFKPSPDDPGPAIETDQLAADEENAGDDSVLQQILRYINPG